jgi:RND superfamily putative drug exporter
MRVLAWLLVALRVVIPVAWIAAAIWATVALPPLGAAGSAPLDDLVAADGDAASQQRNATETFGFPLYTDTVIVSRVEGDTRGRHLAAARDVFAQRTPDLPNLRAVLPVPNDSTVIDYLYFDDEANLAERNEIAHRYARKYLGGGQVTGATPARLAQYEEIQDALPLVEGASILLILLVVGLAFRSVGAPLVALFTAGIAYLLAIRVLPYLGERAGATVPAEVEPIIVVLLLGLVTDYSVFFLSETRRHMRRGETKLVAVRAATRRTLPIVLTAGLIVAAGTGALAVGKLGFFRAFGPGLAITTLISLVVSITLVPALLALFGARIFGRHVEPDDAPVMTDTHAIERAREALRLEEPGPRNRLRMAMTRPIVSIRRASILAERAQTSRWRVVITRVALARPVALVIAIACLGGLGVLAMGAKPMQLG